VYLRCLDLAKSAGPVTGAVQRRVGQVVAVRTLQALQSAHEGSILCPILTPV
jgi:hypothetical protein